MPHKQHTTACQSCSKSWTGAFNGRVAKLCNTCSNREYRAKNRKKTNDYSTKYRLKTKYGITKREWDEMLKAQGHRCAIGRELFTLEDYPVVDHNHTTGKVRGLLCQRCNTGIGMLKESAEHLFAAFNYLEDHKLGLKK